MNKIGVRDDENLNDDLHEFKENLNALKNDLIFLRVINFHETRKRKESKQVFFSKNFEGDFVDQQNLEYYKNDLAQCHWKMTENMGDFRKIISSSSGRDKMMGELKGKRKGTRKEKIGNIHLGDLLMKGSIDLEQTMLLKVKQNDKKTKEI